jgi:hypothetical protein
VREVGGDSDNPLTPLAKTLSGLLSQPRMPIYPQNTPARQEPKQTEIQHTPEARAANSKETDKEPENMLGIFNAVIHQQLLFLVKMAEKDADTEVYANVILDQLPETFHEKLRAELSPPDEGFSKLCAILPDVAKYPDWFMQLIETLLEMLTPEADASGDVLTGESEPGIRNQTEPGSVDVNTSSHTEN